MTAAIEALKKEAAKAAVDLIENDMVVGLGSGSTAAYAIEELAKRVARGLKIIGIPTSEHSQLLAQQHGIPLTTFAKHTVIDLTIDGADQVESGSLNLIKGLGNALLREKIVAQASKKLVIMIDERKLVNCLGNHSPLPVEIVPFGWEVTKQAITKYCPITSLRLAANGKPIVTDSDHYVLDCQISKITDANQLDKDLKLLTGVVETGLFIHMANLVIVAKDSGIVRLQRA
jgi:ribose 5-phosphate isomerase A